MTVEAIRPPRIPPLEPPYEPEIEAVLEKWMPPNSDAEPLKLFRTLCVHPELASRMRPLGAGILGHGLVEPRERELVIHRTCARCGAEYEWGVHVLAFGKPLGLTDEQIAATVKGDSGDPAWSERDADLIGSRTSFTTPTPCRTSCGDGSPANGARNSYSS